MKSNKKEKTLYLCSRCKKFGVRSYKSKIFETFSCPKCKKETTLFLSNQQKINNPYKLKLFTGNEEEINEILPSCEDTKASSLESFDINEDILEKQIFDDITQDLERDVETYYSNLNQNKTNLFKNLFSWIGL